MTNANIKIAMRAEFEAALEKFKADGGTVKIGRTKKKCPRDLLYSPYVGCKNDAPGFNPLRH